jgi:hypothetical protein
LLLGEYVLSAVQRVDMVGVLAAGAGQWRTLAGSALLGLARRSGARAWRLLRMMYLIGSGHAA